MSCQHTRDMVIMTPPPPIHGSVYIGCESPPWRFDFDDLIACEQMEYPDTTILNPGAACAMHEIHKPEGQLSITYSNDFQKGRLLVESKDELIQLLNSELLLVEALYITDTTYFFIEKEAKRFRLNVKNVYVGGCFHELIRWESTQ